MCIRDRYYCVVTATFLTEDSYLGSLTEPLTLNRYNYCVSSYLNYTDPSGNSFENASDKILAGYRKIDSLGHEPVSYTHLDVYKRQFQNRPVSMNPKNNLLEIEEHMYILDDVEKPNVFRNMFPYSEIPKIPFNDRIVPHNMPKDIWITDTTFRDGQQSRAPYTTEQIVKIYDYLHELGGPNGMIRASEFFLYSKKDREDVYKRQGKRRFHDP